MDVRLLPSAFRGPDGGAEASLSQPLTSYLVTGANGAGPLAVDAGSLGLAGEPKDLAAVRGVVLTHAHLDHIASLPMWIEAVLSEDGAPAVVHASDQAIAALRTHIFNEAIFPDFEALTEADGRPLLRLESLPIETPVQLAGFDVRAFPVHHTVATHGLMVDDGHDAVLFSADTGPTERLWDLAASNDRVRAVVIECSFPDRMGAIAESACHLTPSRFRAEIERAPEGVALLVTHMKPAYREEVARAVLGMDDPRIELLEPGRAVRLG